MHAGETILVFMAHCATQVSPKEVVTSSYTKLTKGSHLKAWVFLKSCHDPLAVAGTADTHPSVRTFTSLRPNKQPHRYTKSTQKLENKTGATAATCCFLTQLGTASYSPAQCNTPSWYHNQKVDGAVPPVTLTFPGHRFPQPLDEPIENHKYLSARRLRVFLLCLHLDFRRFLWRCLQIGKTHVQNGTWTLQQIFPADKRCPGNTCSAPKFLCDLLGGKTAWTPSSLPYTVASQCEVTAN